MKTHFGGNRLRMLSFLRQVFPGTVAKSCVHTSMQKMIFHVCKVEEPEEAAGAGSHFVDAPVPRFFKIFMFLRGRKL